MKKKYRISYKNKITGKAGHGNPVYKEEDAEWMSWLLNKEYPEIRHWAEKDNKDDEDE